MILGSSPFRFISGSTSFLLRPTRHSSALPEIPGRTKPKPNASAGRSQARHQERGDRRGARGKRQVNKRAGGTLNGSLVPHDLRDQAVDSIRYRTDRGETPTKTILDCRAQLHFRGATSKFHTCQDRYRKANKHNGKIPQIIGAKRGSWPSRIIATLLLEMGCVFPPHRLACPVNRYFQLASTALLIVATHPNTALNDILGPPLHQ